MKKLVILCIVVATIFFLNNLFAQSFISFKIFLEQQMERRIEEKLISFLGTKDVSVIVRLTISWLTQTSAESSQKTKFRRWDETVEYVLPGVPAAPEMVKKEEQQYLLASAEGKVRYSIEKISVFVLVGKKIDEEKKQQIKKIVLQATDANEARGDEVIIEGYTPLTGAFLQNLPKMTKDIVLSLLFLSLIFFLIGPLRSFLSSYSQIAVVAKPSAPSVETAGLRPELETEETVSKEAVKEKILQPEIPKEERFFDFVNFENLESFKEALLTEPVEVIVKVLHHIPDKKIVSDIFSSFPSEVKIEVAKRFTDIGYGDETTIKNLSERLEKKTKYSYGGARKLAKILQFIEESSQESLLQNLKKISPEFISNVFKYIIKIEDLINYSEQSLRQIYRTVGPQTFARVLSKLPEDLLNKFYEKLGTQISEILKERIKLLPKTIDVREDKIKVIEAVERLVKEGKIPPVESIKNV
jgi:flagellar motor switch protein FliG